MALVACEIIFDPRSPSSPRCGAIYDTNSQTPLPLRLPTFVDAEKFVSAIERSGVSVGCFTPREELAASYRLWNDAHKR